MSRWRANGNDAPSVTYDITAGTHLDEILSEGAKCKYSTLAQIIVIGAVQGKLKQGMSDDDVTVRPSKKNW